MLRTSLALVVLNNILAAISPIHYMIHRTLNAQFA